jgi:hypothetical protein
MPIIPLPGVIFQLKNEIKKKTKKTKIYFFIIFFLKKKLVFGDVVAATGRGRSYDHPPEVAPATSRDGL